MGSLIFKFKQPTSLAYAPGMVISGTDGDPGKQGEAGKSMYFIDYEPDNDYYKELALQRIEQNYILSKDSNVSINERPYRIGDIFLTTSMSCYILDEPEENSSYKFSLRYMGKFRNNVNNMTTNVRSLTAYNVTDSSFCTQESSLSDLHVIKQYSDTYTSCTYTNTHNSKAIMGSWIKFSLVVNQIDPDVEYILKLYLHTKKSYVSNTYDSSLSEQSDIYKPLSFKLTPVWGGDTQTNRINYMFSDIVPTEYSTEEEYFAPRCATAFISDYSLDRMMYDLNRLKCVRTGNRYISDASTGETSKIDASTTIDDYTEKDNWYLFGADLGENERAGDSAFVSFADAKYGNYACSVIMAEKLFGSYSTPPHFQLICRNKKTNVVEIIDEKDMALKYDTTFEGHDYLVTLSSDKKTINTITRISN